MADKQSCSFLYVLVQKQLASWMTEPDLPGSLWTVARRLLDRADVGCVLSSVSPLSPPKMAPACLLQLLQSSAARDDSLERWLSSPWVRGIYLIELLRIPIGHLYRVKMFIIDSLMCE